MTKIDASVAQSRVLRMEAPSFTLTRFVSPVMDFGTKQARNGHKIELNVSFELKIKPLPEVSEEPK